MGGLYAATMLESLGFNYEVLQASDRLGGRQVLKRRIRLFRQFPPVYENLTRPAANGGFRFAGEAVNARHGWVEGALDASWRTVEEIIRFSFTGDDRFRLLNKFHGLWGRNPDWLYGETEVQIVASCVLQEWAAAY
ncbi:uncharacterized protein LAESUDRAFT_422128 [Laetiporus sulphureus 93-53]|uniref:Amine oxidase domain-containing protein n=1 Tax=Laetiporus sulphureus 93-53 TaxID=1314785 RepID=A0A165GHJ6_9APHY|nr:uncharacterized protein LAESUDRAFT_422128 [Laetiporus sulphureus 93-53]KZT10356.1 hypothetical protein LAESUDRAFT_422128 [Laetiporus sulphureus 93-53]